MQICKHLRQECNEQLALINLIRSDKSKRRRTSVKEATIDCTEPQRCRFDIQFRVVPTACALLQSALKELTATGPASDHRLYQARLEGVTYDEALRPILRDCAAVVSTNCRIRNRRKPRRESYPAF